MNAGFEKAIVRKFRPIVRKFRQKSTKKRSNICVIIFIAHFIFIYLQKQTIKNMENLPVKIAQANQLSMARYDFSVIEKRCLYFVIKEVRRLFVDSKKGQKDLFDNMYLQIPSEQLRGLADEIKDVYTALKKLSDKSIEIENENVWIYTRWILQAKHEKKRDTYNVDVSREIMPYLVELAQSFTTYDLMVALTLKSIYSQRMYELCSQYKNRQNKTFFLELEKLRFILKVEDKKSYQNVAQLKRDILEVAQKELQTLYEKGQCDLYFTYRTKDTQGRKILSYYFDIHTKESLSEIDYMTTEAQIRRILEIITAFIKNDKKYYKRVQTALQLTPNVTSEVLEKLNKKVLDYKKEDLALIIRYVFHEDYGIK